MNGCKFSMAVRRHVFFRKRLSKWWYWDISYIFDNIYTALVRILTHIRCCSNIFVCQCHQITYVCRNELPVLRYGNYGKPVYGLLRMSVLVVWAKQVHLDLSVHSGFDIPSNAHYLGHTFANNDLVWSSIHVYNIIASHLLLHQGCAHKMVVIMTSQTNSRALLDEITTLFMHSIEWKWSLISMRCI